MSSLGSTIAAFRHERHLTQRELSRVSGLGVAYLSRLESDRLTPSIRTLNRLASALEVPVGSFFEAGATEFSTGCPVSASGRCVLDAGFATRGHKGRQPGRYNAEHLRAMKLCDFLMHEGDAPTRQAVVTLLNALTVLTGDGKETPAREDQSRRRSS